MYTNILPRNVEPAKVVLFADDTILTVVDKNSADIAN